MLAETYLIATTDQIDTSVQSMQDCISDVKTWMTSNKLKLNDDKTESAHCLEQKRLTAQEIMMHLPIVAFPLFLQTHYIGSIAVV